MKISKELQYYLFTNFVATITPAIKNKECPNHQTRANNILSLEIPNISGALEPKGTYASPNSQAR